MPIVNRTAKTESFAPMPQFYKKAAAHFEKLLKNEEADPPWLYFGMIVFGLIRFESLIDQIYYSYLPGYLDAILRNGVGVAPLHEKMRRDYRNCRGWAEKLSNLDLTLRNSIRESNESLWLDIKSMQSLRNLLLHGIPMKYSLTGAFTEQTAPEAEFLNDYGKVVHHLVNRKILAEKVRKTPDVLAPFSESVAQWVWDSTSATIELIKKNSLHPGFASGIEIYEK